ncbi:hypothetical protein B0H13DRAFT_1888290 [Mycena leptocephala]|nr:hypothetical protein B0H13DRAFT_1888290 [Mycena leptocephala]
MEDRIHYSEDIEAREQVNTIPGGKADAVGQRPRADEVADDIELQEIGGVGRAWIFFGMEVVLGVYLAVTTLSRTALYNSIAVWPLYIIYPTGKRWTNLVPIPLVSIYSRRSTEKLTSHQGLMFKVGIFMGWSDLSVDGSIPWNTLIPIYLGACLWTITYETVYQHQDKINDLKIGINSPALLCRGYTIPREWHFEIRVALFSFVVVFPQYESDQMLLRVEHIQLRTAKCGYDVTATFVHRPNWPRKTLAGVDPK